MSCIRLAVGKSGAGLGGGRVFEAVAAFLGVVRLVLQLCGGRYEESVLGGREEGWEVAQELRMVGQERLHFLFEGG